MNIKRVYYWCGLTVTQPFNTGVQRVTRCLGVALQKLGIEVIPVKWNGDKMVAISQSEADHLAKWGGPTIAPPLSLPEKLNGEWLLIPEITHPVVPAGSNVARLGRTLGMKVAAVFYDMIPLKTPELYSPETLEWLDRYWATFASVDLAIPISETVRFDLVEWLLQKQLRIPFIAPALLAGEIPGVPRTTVPAIDGSPFNLVAVGTWEPRKNYPRILRAVKAARASTGADIRITIVGRKAQAEYPNLHQDMFTLADEMGPDAVQLRDYLSDDDMDHLFKTAQATIFGSWIEGFGLPVLESLWRGLPCVCHDGSALAEIAPGGGTIMVDMQNDAAIADSLASLVIDKHLFTRLAHEAVTRPIRTWDDYGEQVLAILEKTEFMSYVIDYDPLAV